MGRAGGSLFGRLRGSRWSSIAYFYFMHLFLHPLRRERSRLSHLLDRGLGRDGCLLANRWFRGLHRDRFFYASDFRLRFLRKSRRSLGRFCFRFPNNDDFLPLRVIEESEAAQDSDKKSFPH